MFKKFNTLGCTSKDAGLQGNYISIIASLNNTFSYWSLDFSPTIMRLKSHLQGLK